MSPHIRQAGARIEQPSHRDNHNTIGQVLADGVADNCTHRDVTSQRQVAQGAVFGLGQCD